MKKLLYFIFALMCLCTVGGCSDSDNEQEEPVVPEISLQGNTNFDPQPSAAGNLRIDFTTNVDWRIGANQGWCHLSPASGGAGQHSVTVTLDENTTYDLREAVIKLTAGTLTKEFKVQQVQKDAIVAAKEEYVVEAAAKELELKVNANVDFTVETTADWLKQVGTKGLTSHTLKFTIEPNETYDAREAFIVLKSGAIVQQIKVVQAQKDALVVAKKEYALNELEQELEFAVTTNLDLEVKCNVDWLKQVPATKGLKEVPLKFTVAANEGYDAREGVITISGRSLKQEIKVVQAQKDAMVVAKHEQVVGNDASVLELEVKANVDFTVETTVDWITKMADTKGLKETKVRFQIQKNPVEEQREGLIRFVSGNLVQEVKVTQMNTDAIVVAKNEYDLPYQATTLDIEVESNVVFEVSCNVDWLKQAVTKGMEKQTLHFTVSENKGEEARVGIITLKKGVKKQEIKVKQGAKGTIVVAEKEITVASNETKLNFNVNANVEFKVTTDVEWIRETTKARAMEVYPLSFELDENTGYDDRVGHITVTGGGMTQEIKVTQLQKDAIVIAQKEYSLSCEKQELRFEVNTNVKLDKVETNASWLTQVAETKGLQAVPLAFSVAANEAEVSREAVITVCSGSLKQEIKVVQAGFVKMQRVVITHLLKSYTVPVFKGKWVEGVVAWGDDAKEAYKEGLSHSYSTDGKHVVEIEMKEVNEVRVQNIRGIEFIDLTEF